MQPEDLTMVFETDNSESRIGQAGDSLTNEGLVSEAYAGMSELMKQQRSQRQTNRSAGSGSDFIDVPDPYHDLRPTILPRTDQLQPVPGPPIHWEPRRRELPPLPPRPVHGGAGGTHRH